MDLDPEILEAIFTNKDQDLRTLSEKKTIMLVFLRHFGCTFCRETLSDLTDIKDALASRNMELIMVHMSSEDVAESFFEQYDLMGISHISDPDCSLYEYFGVSRGSFLQLYGLKVWLRGFKAALIDGRGRPIAKKGLGDYTRMPGIFVLKNCKVVEKFIHNSAADRPDYAEIVSKSSSKF
ncbi:MAG: redoxin domain-containing protein [Saprospiraceae bacterium]|nr:redoxin domain-containing protein [Saprospiraceae bacterium]